MPVFRPRCGAQLTVAFDGRGGPNKIFTIDHVKPRESTVNRNGYHEADTWSMSFDLRVFPFDPEGIASIAARIYMWDDLGSPAYEWAVDGNEMVRGLADVETIHIDKSRNEFSCSGRDYTGILDPEWDPRVQVPAGVPLRQAVETIANTAAPDGSEARFQVVWDVKDDDGNPLPETEFLSNGSARSTKKKGMWVKQGKTTWDVIYDLVIQNGFICFVRDSQIIITNPRTQTNAQLQSAPTVAHGRNLKSFSAERKMAKERVPRIRLVYWDAGGQRQFDVVYPEKDQKITIGLGIKKNEDLILPAPSYCHDAESARRYAKMRWELMARAETTYKIETRHLVVPRGDGTNFLTRRAAAFLGVDDGFDLLRLQAGDAIAIRFDPFNQESMRSLDVGQREEFLKSLGYHERVSAFVANNIERLETFRQPFYVRTANYEYSNTEGISISVEAVNFAYERREIQWSDGDLKSDSTDPRTQTPAQRKASSTPLFTDEGPRFYAAAFAHNSAFATDGPFNAVLSFADEVDFRAWIFANSILFAPSDSIVDYDMRRYWLEFIKPGGVFEGGHFPDTYKTPYDTTFSSESIYAKPGCPFNWHGETLIDDRSGQVIFANGSSGGR